MSDNATGGKWVITRKDFHSDDRKAFGEEYGPFIKSSVSADYKLEDPSLKEARQLASGTIMHCVTHLNQSGTLSRDYIESFCASNFGPEDGPDYQQRAQQLTDTVAGVFERVAAKLKFNKESLQK